MLSNVEINTFQNCFLSFEGVSIISVFCAQRIMNFLTHITLSSKHKEPFSMKAKILIYPSIL